MHRFDWCIKWLVVATLLAGCASDKYSQSVTEQKSIPHVSVNASHKTDGIYEVEVVNDLPHAISLQWNSSAYLNTKGGTVRLIHIENLDEFPATVPLEQLPSIIVPGATLKTWFVGESWIDYARRGVTPRPFDSDKTAMFFLAFHIDGKRTYWKGSVSFAPLQQ